MSELECPSPEQMSSERLNKVLTQYRESPKLLGLISVYLKKATQTHVKICDLPSRFNIDTAIGDQLTILGRRMGFPRSHKSCQTPRVHGFECDSYDDPFINLSGFCDENSTWLDCFEAVSSQVTINNDETYRKFLKARRYQMLRRYDFKSLTLACRELWGDQAFIAKIEKKSVIFAIGRTLNSEETELLKIYPRVLPLILGTGVKFHLNDTPVAGFGEGWGGFCVEGDSNIHAQWLCPIDINPYEC